MKYQISEIKNGVWGEEPTGDDDILCIRVADFERETRTVRPKNPTFRSISVSERKGRLLRSGELLIEKSGGGENQPVGTVVRFTLSDQAVCSNFVARVVPARSQDSRFLCYLHRSLYDARWNTRSIKQNTGIQNLDLDAYFDDLAPNPELTEQIKIADFLDRETAKIDELIQKKRELIERLKEKRTALISHVVTKGLPPEEAAKHGLPVNPPLKPSGVPWIGEVPAHWNIERLKFSSISRVSNVDKVSADDELPVRLCNYVDVYKNDQIHSDLPFMEGTATPEEIAKFGLRVGDVIITKDSENWRDIAIPAFVRETAPDLVCGYHLAIVRADRRRVLPRFLFDLFRSRAVNTQFQVAASGVTRYGLPKAAVGDAIVPIPPRDEQAQIAAFLDRETAKIDDLIAKLASAIEKLQEYRSALITAAVTGKIDVRGAVPSDLAEVSV